MIVKRIRFYSDGEKKEKRIKLSDIESHRGLGRSFLLGGLQGAVGGYAGKNEAEKADEEGASDSEIIRRAGIGTLAGGTMLGSGAGALGGHLGAKKNARTRIEKRRLMESSRR